MKKRLKKLSIVFIIGIMLLLIFLTCRQIGFTKIKAYFSDFVFAEEFSDKKPFSELNFSKLNETEKKAYICILDKIGSHPEYIKIPYLSNEEFTNVYFAVKNDNPDILCFSDSCNMVTFLSSCFLQVDYAHSNSVCDEMMAELDNISNEIIKNITGTDEYSAELYIHDYIIKHCTYDETAENSSNAYGCLVNGAAVCSGYSRAAMLLLKKAGIYSMLVSGTGITDENEAISHMWNIVWIDNEPYHLDVTWDDTDDTDNTTSHMFFNLTTADISLDHKDISADISCISDEANYFKREQLIFSTYGRDVLENIQQALCARIDNKVNYIEFCFTDKDPYSRAVKAIIDNSVPRSDMYAIIDYISEHAKEAVDMTHINFVKDDNKYYIRIMFDSV